MPQRASSTTAVPSSSARLGELVDDDRAGRAGSGRRRTSPFRLHPLQPRREEVGRDGHEPFGKVAVPAGTGEQLADDEQGPALPGDVERVGETAVLVVESRDSGLTITSDHLYKSSILLPGLRTGCRLRA